MMKPILYALLLATPLRAAEPRLVNVPPYTSVQDEILRETGDTVGWLKANGWKVSEQAPAPDTGPTREAQAKGSGPRYKWDVAAIDRPVPASLIGRAELADWRNYLSCLSPAQQLRELGQALDELHGALERTPDPRALPEPAQRALYSLWVAVQEAGVDVAERFGFPAKERHSSAFTSDVDESLFLLLDFLKQVRSAEVEAWEARRARHDRLDTNAFSDFLDRAAARYHPH
ncbi:MAG: hypothetical protein HY554_02645 [Elusimicrobia bacterium]|nr:hypothetical protein [Elusimicrobiota bacterium]